MASAVYCNRCADERSWPRQTSQDVNYCQFCKKVNMCSEINAGVLPEPITITSLPREGYR